VKIINPVSTPAWGRYKASKNGIMVRYGSMRRIEGVPAVSGQEV
jgi:hypothetical protein